MLNLPATTAQATVGGSVAVQADDKIVSLISTRASGSTFGGQVRRVLANGSADTSFGSGGIATLPNLSGSDAFTAC